eukprot:scaffold23_cov268-Pinguiococcus_pyrenoidosus.AAC.11
MDVVELKAGAPAAEEIELVLRHDALVVEVRTSKAFPAVAAEHQHLSLVDCGGVSATRRRDARPRSRVDHFAAVGLGGLGARRLLPLARVGVEEPHIVQPLRRAVEAAEVHDLLPVQHATMLEACLWPASALGRRDLGPVQRRRRGPGSSSLVGAAEEEGELAGQGKGMARALRGQISQTRRLGPRQLCRSLLLRMGIRLSASFVESTDVDSGKESDAEAEKEQENEAGRERRKETHHAGRSSLVQVDRKTFASHFPEAKSNKLERERRHRSKPSWKTAPLYRLFQVSFARTSCAFAPVTATHFPRCRVLEPPCVSQSRAV